MNWKGVMPAITTCFDQDYRVDHEFIVKHCQWLLDNGCTGIVTLGSLGEGATLTFEEKIAVLRNCVRAETEATTGSGQLGESRRRCRLRRFDGFAALCVSG